MGDPGCKFLFSRFNKLPLFAVRTKNPLALTSNLDNPMVSVKAKLCLRPVEYLSFLLHKVEKEASDAQCIKLADRNLVHNILRILGDQGFFSTRIVCLDNPLVSIQANICPASGAHSTASAPQQWAKEASDSYCTKISHFYRRWPLVRLAVRALLFHSASQSPGFKGMALSNPVS